MRQTTKDASKKQVERQRKLRAKRKAAGLCVDCGELKAHGFSPTKERPYLTCKFCREKSKLRTAEHEERKNGVKSSDEEIIDHPTTTTAKKYKVKDGRIGTVVACPCPDPIILEFKDGTRDAFHLRNCKEVTTKSASTIDPEHLAGIVPILQYFKEITHKGTQ